MMCLAFGAHKRNAELPVNFDIQREKRPEALPVRNPDIILQTVDIRIGIAGMQVRDRTELKLFR